MNEPMTTPEDKKAAQCPLCSCDARVETYPFIPKGIVHPHACCRRVECALFNVWIPLDQWNTRPREKALEGVLRETEETLKACRRQFSLCDGDCEIPHSYTAALSAINAALEEKR